MTARNRDSGAGMLSVVLVLTVEKTRRLLLGPAFLVLLLAQQAALFLLQRNALLSLDQNGLLVMLHPAQYGLLTASLMLVLFVVVYASASPARERETGSMETLFYGPVSPGAYVVSEVLTLALSVVVSQIFLLLALLVGRLVVGTDLPASVLLLFPYGLLVNLSLAAVALWAALFFRQARAAIALMVAVTVVSLALAGGELALAGSGAGGSFFVVFLRNSLSHINGFFRFVFPLGLFLDEVVRYESFGSLNALRTGYQALYGMAFVLGAVATMRRRGVMVR